MFSVARSPKWRVPRRKTGAPRSSPMPLATRPLSLKPDPPGLRWLDLQVRRCVQDDAEHATVEFVVRSKLAGRAHRLHETSRFERTEGRWLYVDAQG